VFGGSVVLEVTDHPNAVALAPACEEIRRGLKERVDAAQGHPMDLSITDIYNLAGDPLTLRRWAVAAQETVS
ncbi:MAG: hypothetical protein GX620_06775, partial [Chloroflexi bacterium]|nr:hypothetical protein [Chloroflexota bacterium]